MPTTPPNPGQQRYLLLGVIFYLSGAIDHLLSIYEKVIVHNQINPGDWIKILVAFVTGG
jgi:hypothetical protein